MFAGYLLLVAQADRPDARRDARQDALLAAVHRVPRHVPDPALAGRRGHAASLRRLPAERRFHARSTRSPRSGAFLLGASTLVFFYNVWKSRNSPEVDDRRPVGLGPLARVGDHLPAAAPQLHPAARGSAQSRRRSISITPRLRSRSTATAEEQEEFDDGTVDAPNDTGRKAELRHRVSRRYQRLGRTVGTRPPRPIT